jgi:hypothetical protein
LACWSTLSIVAGLGILQQTANSNVLYAFEFYSDHIFLFNLCFFTSNVYANIVTHFKVHDKISRHRIDRLLNSYFHKIPSSFNVDNLFGRLRSASRIFHAFSTCPSPQSRSPSHLAPSHPAQLGLQRHLCFTARPVSHIRRFRATRFGKHKHTKEPCLDPSLFQAELDY